ncbi:hypothetical protein F4782DRAFT_501465 [Xylaria castorea]|nr:hypothetical protein F4782DRAFT_501465 [Xylaria castorea]
MLPKSTLNALAQIIMPSMTIIADFLDQTKHYQTKLSSEGGRLGSSWCKMGWALFRRDELKLLRDTLHARLSAINTLLVAANHLPSQKLPALPDSISQFEVAEDSTENYGFPDAAETIVYSENSPSQDMSVITSSPTPSKYNAAVSPAPEQDQHPVETEITIIEPGNKANAVVADSADNISMITTSAKPNATCSSEHGISKASEMLSIVKTISKPPANPRITRPSQSTGHRSPNHAAQRVRTIPPTSVKSTINPTEVAQGNPQDLESYLHDLLQTAITIQADAEAKEKAAQRAAEEAEWRKRFEESVWYKVEIEVRDRMNLERREAEKIKATEEAKKALESQEKAPIKFKDAAERKFTLPFHICTTWQGIEEVVKKAFLHVDTIGPHVQAGHYDLIGPNGEVILPHLWEKTVEPGWSITMKIWPMNRPGPLRPIGSRPGLLPGGPGIGGQPSRPTMPMPRMPFPGVISIVNTASVKKEKRSVGSFLSKKFKGLRRRKSISSTSSSGSSSTGSEC